MVTSFAGSGPTIPPFQYQLGGGNGVDFGSLSSYSTQGASMFGGMGGGNLGLQMPGAGGTIAGAAPGIGGGGPLPIQGGGILGAPGMNIPTLQLGLGMLSSLGGLYGAFQANKLARDSFNYTKDVTNTNLNNQIKSYNTALEDRYRSRAVQEGRSQESAQEQIDRNRLSR